MKKRIGIMGGTFNPIHMGHLILAEEAYQQMKLEKVFFMPSKQPPHKPNMIIAPQLHRKNMVSLAIKGNPHFELSTIELEREGVTYTADTLEILTSQNPEIQYYFIIGADSLFQLESWREPEKIMKLSSLLAASRYHLPEEELMAQIRYLTKEYGAQISLLYMPCIELSSEFLRNQLKEKREVRYYIPEAVSDYIKKNQLYYY